MNEIEHVTFGIDGFDYIVDLDVEDAAALRAALAPFVEKAIRTDVAARRKAAGRAAARLRRRAARPA